jgi:hypothetical protein
MKHIKLKNRAGIKYSFNSPSYDTFTAVRNLRQIDVYLTADTRKKFSYYSHLIQNVGSFGKKDHEDGIDED